MAQKKQLFPTQFSQNMVSNMVDDNNPSPIAVIRFEFSFDENDTMKVTVTEMSPTTQEVVDHFTMMTSARQQLMESNKESLMMRRPFKEYTRIMKITSASQNEGFDVGVLLFDLLFVMFQSVTNISRLAARCDDKQIVKTKMRDGSFARKTYVLSIKAAYMFIASMEPRSLHGNLIKNCLLQEMISLIVEK